KQWAPKLIVCKFWISFTKWKMDYSLASHLPSLIEALNRCTLLQHLTFDLKNRFRYRNSNDDEKPSLHLSLLGWIHEFYCNFPEFSDEIVEQLVRYGASNEA